MHSTNEKKNGTFVATIAIEFTVHSMWDVLYDDNVSSNGIYKTVINSIWLLIDIQ